MFRKSRSAHSESGGDISGQDSTNLHGTPRAEEERTDMNDAPKPQASPARSLSDIPPVPVGGQPQRRGPAEPASYGARAADARMTVGPGIRLKGEIADCTTLVVEGTVEVTLTTDLLEVAEGGTFKGAATVANAEIQGAFDGELTVSGLLRIHSTGQVRGTIKYGRIEVSAGGEIAGNIGNIEEPAVPERSPSTVGPKTEEPDREEDAPRQQTA